MNCKDCFQSHKNYGECSEKIDKNENPIKIYDLNKHRDKRDPYDNQGNLICNSYVELIHGVFHCLDGQWGVMSDGGDYYPMCPHISARIKKNMEGLRISVGVENGEVIDVSSTSL